MAATEPPPPPPAILYVDTSVLLKLLVREAESAAVERELLTWRELATSVIAEVELPRAVERAREERTDAVIDGSLVLQGVLSSAAIIPLSEGVVAAARKVKPVYVGALAPSTSPARSASANSLQAWQPTTSACRTPSIPSGSA
jgi:predicted nucleic acid-binding protein